MTETVGVIVAAVIGSNGLFALLQFLINRHDIKKNLKGKLTTLEKDVLRTQMLLMILLRPEEKKEILTIGQHYFEDLKGNWYMTDVFNTWLEAEGHSKPEWFKPKE